MSATDQAQKVTVSEVLGALPPAWIVTPTGGFCYSPLPGRPEPTSGEKHETLTAFLRRCVEPRLMAQHGRITFSGTGAEIKAFRDALRAKTSPCFSFWLGEQG